LQNGWGLLSLKTEAPCPTRKGRPETGGLLHV